MTFKGETIWIVGASSGIGRALAIELASQGATLVLSSRNEEQLKKLGGDLGGQHKVCVLDVSDSKQVNKVAREISEQGKLDRAIFMAALYEPSNIKDMDLEFTKKLVDVNLLGALYLTHAIYPIFEKQSCGQLVFCASVAGYTGLPSGQPYSATKAALINFAESLYAEAEDYIEVKVINPGFVRTPATDKNDYNMPMRIEADEAARAIAKGLKSRSFEIHFPKKFTYLMKILAALPYWAKLFVTRRM